MLFFVDDVRIVGRWNSACLVVASAASDRGQMVKIS